MYFVIKIFERIWRLFRVKYLTKSSYQLQRVSKFIYEARQQSIVCTVVQLVTRTTELYMSSCSSLPTLAKSTNGFAHSREHSIFPSTTTLYSILPPYRSLRIQTYNNFSCMAKAPCPGRRRKYVVFYRQTHESCTNWYKKSNIFLDTCCTVFGLTTTRLYLLTSTDHIRCGLAA